jgi:hypothetical protein
VSTSQATPVTVASSEGGFSILRLDAEMDRNRRNFERTSTFGRYGLLGFGAVAAGSGTALVAAHYATAAFAILAFGLLLMILGGVQHILYLRGRAHWPNQVLLFDGGVEVVLSNGDVRAIEWEDPKLDLEVQTQPEPLAGGESAILFWRMDRSIPPCAITPEGFARLQAEVVQHGLTFRETRRGPRGKEARLLEIRPAPPKPVVKSPSDWGP